MATPIIAPRIPTAPANPVRNRKAMRAKKLRARFLTCATNFRQPCGFAS
jgi:hypothetical protein